jgi:hypothetical protein
LLSGAPQLYRKKSNLLEGRKVDASNSKERKQKEKIGEKKTFSIGGRRLRCPWRTHYTNRKQEEIRSVDVE